MVNVRGSGPLDKAPGSLLIGETTPVCTEPWTRFSTFKLSHAHGPGTLALLFAISGMCLCLIGRCMS
jgi:hypothetical protein